MATKEKELEELTEKMTEADITLKDGTDVIFRVVEKGIMYEVVFHSEGTKAEVSWNDSFKGHWEVLGFLDERYPETATQTLPDGRSIVIPFRQALKNLIQTQMQQRPTSEDMNKLVADMGMKKGDE